VTDPSVVVEPTKWLGETMGFWIQTALLAISALGAVWIIKARGTQEKRRATVDAIIHQKAESKLRDARAVIRRMHENKEKNLAKHLENPTSEECIAIIEVLNAYEFIASGIRQGAFDEGTYKRLRCSNVLNDWQILYAFVQEMRNSKDSSTLFQDFKWLAARWRGKPLKADEERTNLSRL
jgi:hypothetical protein